MIGFYLTNMIFGSIWMRLVNQLDRWRSQLNKNSKHGMINFQREREREREKQRESLCVCVCVLSEWYWMMILQHIKHVMLEAQWQCL